MQREKEGVSQKIDARFSATRGAVIRVVTGVKDIVPGRTVIRDLKRDERGAGCC